MEHETMRILLIDDNHKRALSLGNTLRQELRISASSCSSLPDALQQIASNPPHTVVLDYHLPDSPGPQSLTAISGQLDTPVIVVSDHPSDTEAAQAIRAGAQAYLPRPHLHPRTLTALVRRALSYHQRRRELAHLKHTAHALASSLEFDAIVSAALDGLTALLQPDAAWLLLPGAGGELDLIASRGLPPDVIADPDSARFHSRLSAPVIAKRDARPGFLCVASKAHQRFSPHHLELLDTIASHTASALHNAELFAALARAKAQWECTFDSISDPILISDQNFRLLRLNRAAARCFCLPLQQAAGRICHRTLFHSDQPCPWHNALLRGVSVSCDRHLPHLQRSFSLSAFPFQDQQGHSLGVVHVLRDLTQERKLSEHLPQAQKPSAQPADPEKPLVPHHSTDLAHHLPSQERDDE